MNKLEELEKQYAKLGEEIEKLKKEEIDKLEKGEEKYFVPKENEKYWFLDKKDLDFFVYNNDAIDKDILKRQMPRRTEAEAEFYDQKRIYETQYRKYLLDHEEEPVNWEKHKQEKYYAFYNYDEKGIRTYWDCYTKDQGTIYTTREESITEFAKQIGEENFIKYILIGEYKED